jgi:signal transduction histidine kinase
MSLTPESTTPPTVLLLAERGSTLDAATVLLAGDGYRVLRCHGTEDVLNLLARERPRVLVLSERKLEGSGADLVRRLRAADPMVAIVLQSRARDVHRRSRLVDDLGLDAVHGEDEDPARLLELVACLLSRSRRLEQTVAEHEIRALFLTKLCHGLRTSMHVIHGYTQILRADHAGTPNEDILTRLNSASEGALELLRRHLGHGPAEPTPAPVRLGVYHGLVNVGDLIRSACVDAVDQAGPRSVRVRSAVPWPAAFIRTDGEKLRRILTEMTVATLKTVNSGEIQVAVELGAGETNFTLRHLSSVSREEEQLAEAARVHPRVFYPVSEGSARAFGVEVAVRLSSCIGASLGTARSESGGSVFTLRVPAAVVMQPDYRSPTVH